MDRNEKLAILVFGAATVMVIHDTYMAEKRLMKMEKAVLEIMEFFESLNTQIKFANIVEHYHDD